MLMMRGDLDVLEEVLDCNYHYFEIFVLDGTEIANDSKNFGQILKHQIGYTIKI